MHLLTKSRAQTILADCARPMVTPQLVPKYGFPPGYRRARRMRRRSLIGPVISLPLRAWGNLFAPPGSWDVQPSLFCHQTGNRDHKLT